MAKHKIDLWEMVKELDMPDKFTVDHLKVLFDERQQKAYLDDQDEREYVEYFKEYEEKLLELKATLSAEQMKLFWDVDNAMRCLHGLEFFAAYKQGFRDGVLLMFSVLHGNKDALEENVNEARENESEELCGAR